MGMTSNVKKEKLVICAYLAAFASIFLFLMWKCRYGVGNIDESFYLTVPYRMCRGDSLILHEWHLSQLAGFLLYPAVKAHLLLFGSTEGILLHFRILFTLVWSAASLFFFYRLKSVTLAGAALGSLFFMIYTPFGIMALSYNSMGILLFLSCGVMIITAQRSVPVQYIIAGVLFAGAVLCCPFLLLVYILFTITALLLRKNSGILKCWFMVSLGSALLCLVFVLWVLSRASVGDLLKAFPYLFQDPQHPHVPLTSVIYNYFSNILLCNKLFLPGLVISAGITLYSKIKGKPELGLSIISMIVFLIQLDFLIEKPYINYVMFPLNLIAPYCAVHSSKKEIQLPFWAIWIPGLVYTFCVCLSSNQWFYVITSVSTVMTVASAVMMFCFIRQLNPDRMSRGRMYAVVITTVLVIGIQLYAELSLRYSSVFWEDGGMKAQTVLGESGPEKGILMSPEWAEFYADQEEDMEVIRNDQNITNLLVLSDYTYLYLSAEKEMATFSAWLSGVNESSIQRLESYYRLLPQKVPDAIYVGSGYAEFAKPFISKGYKSEILPSGSYLLRRYGQAGYSGETSKLKDDPIWADPQSVKAMIISDLHYTEYKEVDPVLVPGIALAGEITDTIAAEVIDRHPAS